MSGDWFKQKLSGRSAIIAQPAPQASLSSEELAAEMRMVESDIVQGKVTDALIRVDRLALSNPDNAEVIAHQGICHNLLGDAEASIDPLVRAAKIAPENARTLYFLAASLAVTGRVDEAAQISKKALGITPRDLNLLVLMGTIFGRLGAVQEAAKYLNQALEFHPESIAPLHTLEILAQQTLKRSSVYDLSPKVADVRRRAINRLLVAYRKKRLDPDGIAVLISILSGSPERFSTAVEIANESVELEPMPIPLAQQMFLTFWAAGDTAQALRFSELCYEREPNRPNYREALCSSWLASGSEHWNSAWRILLESQQKSRPDQYAQTVPMWAGQKLGKKKLLVYQDQGMGDALIGFRFLPILAARGVKFDLWVLPAMADLAAQTQGYEALIRTDYRLDPAALGYPYAAPLFGLIHALYLTPEEVREPPLLRPGPQQALALRERVRALSGVKIGIVYGGNPDRRDDWLRSVPLDSLRGIANIPGISWVNLMMDERTDKARAIEMFRMADMMKEVNNFADTAAIVEELDAVVAVDCSVAHLAGSLGKPLWALAPPSADWRWQIGADTRPWWPTANLLRSEEPGVWKRAVVQLEIELKTFTDKLNSEN